MNGPRFAIFVAAILIVGIGIGFTLGYTQVRDDQDVALTIEEGRAAFDQGIPRDANPHRKLGWPISTAWDVGWRRAQREAAKQ